MGGGGGGWHYVNMVKMICWCSDQASEKGDLSDFEQGMVVGARRAGLSISETADLIGFSPMTISRVYRKWWEAALCVKNALLIPEVREEWPNLSKLIEGNSNSNGHSL